jgi:phosphonate transport system substrate-binding protein
MSQSGLYISIVSVALAFFLTACNQSTPDVGPKYEPVRSDAQQAQLRLAVHPLYNPTKLGQVYNPLIDFLTKSIKGSSFLLEASRDYPSYEEKIKQGSPDILIPNPWQTIEAMQSGYEVIAMVGKPEEFTGLIVVRKDSGIKTPADLKGKTICYPASTAIAACMMPQMFLHSYGLDINKDLKNEYVGSQESSIMNVYLKHATAGGTWPPPWKTFQMDHPKEAQELIAIWETPALTNLSVMVKKSMPDKLKQQLRSSLTSLTSTKDGLAILATMKTTGINPASDKDYDVVRDFMQHFERDIRKVKAL